MANINNLPYDIMGRIISLLPTDEETARVAIICKHWLSLWNYLRTNAFYLTLDYNTPEVHPSRYLTQSKLKFPCFDLNMLSREEFQARFPSKDRLFQDAIESFPLLQEFRLICCPHVRNFTISSQTLKNLEIIRCKNLIRLNLDVPMLVSFKHEGPFDPQYEFVNVHNLVQLTLVDTCCKRTVDARFNQFEPILDRILKISFVLNYPLLTECPQVYRLRGVRELRMDIRVRDTQFPPFLLGILLESFPGVEKVSFHLDWPQFINPRTFGHAAPAFDRCYIPFHGVREFKLDGYIGNGSEFEIIRILVRMAKLLRKVVVRASRRDPEVSDDDLMRDTERQIGLTRARQDIQTLLPPYTEFVLL